MFKLKQNSDHFNGSPKIDRKLKESKKMVFKTPWNKIHIKLKHRNIIFKVYAPLYQRCRRHWYKFQKSLERQIPKYQSKTWIKVLLIKISDLDEHICCVLVNLRAFRWLAFVYFLARLLLAFSARFEESRPQLVESVFYVFLGDWLWPNLPEELWLLRFQHKSFFDMFLCFQ